MGFSVMDWWFLSTENLSLVIENIRWKIIPTPSLFHGTWGSMKYLGIENVYVALGWGGKDNGWLCKASGDRAKISEKDMKIR